MDDRFVSRRDERHSEASNPSVDPVFPKNRVGSSGECNNIFVNSGLANMAQDPAVKFPHLSRELFDGL